MTQQQKAAIELMRAQGRSYREIGEELGLSVSVIKMYFYRKEHQLDKTQLCAFCHKPINTIPVRPNRRFCSPECRSKWWTQHKAIERAKSHQTPEEFLQSVTEPSTCSVEVLISGKASLGEGVTGYIASMAIAGVMLSRKIISEAEFLFLEKQLLEKYGLPENSIYRDYRIVKTHHSSDE